MMDIRPSYSCLLGRLWIHKVGAVTSPLHQMLKYPVKGKIVMVRGEEEYMVSHLNSFRYMEIDGDFIETLFQHFEEVLQTLASAETVNEDPPMKLLIISRGFFNPDHVFSSTLNHCKYHADPFLS